MSSEMIDTLVGVVSTIVILSLVALYAIATRDYDEINYRLECPGSSDVGWSVNIPKSDGVPISHNNVVMEYREACNIHVKYKGSNGDGMRDICKECSYNLQKDRAFCLIFPYDYGRFRHVLAFESCKGFVSKDSDKDNQE